MHEGLQAAPWLTQAPEKYVTQEGWHWQSCAVGRENQCSEAAPGVPSECFIGLVYGLENFSVTSVRS